MKKKIERRTVKVFDKLHKAQLQNKKIYYRLTNLLSTNFLNVNKSFFKNKICLDAACGANANATFNMLSLGAKYVYGFDINKNVITTATKTLNKNFKGKFNFKKSNLLKINYRSNFFDFVHCAGAIHHTVNYKKSISELCRVTKPGGYIFLEFYGKGGLAREITNLLRNKYKKDKKFKKLIDDLNKKELSNIYSFINKIFRKMNILKRNRLIKSFQNNIDEDLILTIKDRVQSPIYKEFDENDVIRILKKNKFKDIKRVSKYPIFFNMRKYLAPFYYDYKNKYSNIFYGNGMPQIIAKKKKQ